MRTRNISIQPWRSFIVGVTFFAVAVPAVAELVIKSEQLVYDTDRDITWLRDTSSRGRMTFIEAEAVARELSAEQSFGGSNWRLPNTPTAIDPTCFDRFNTGFTCHQSEMGHMYYIELGNQAGSPNYGELTNRGPFNDLKEALYWSGTVNEQDEVWLFSFFNGVQEIKAKDTTAYVWLVHDGELAPIIKQSTMPRSTVFLILGLLAVILILAYYIRRYYKQDP